MLDAKNFNFVRRYSGKVRSSNGDKCGCIAMETVATYLSVAGGCLSIVGASAVAGYLSLWDALLLEAGLLHEALSLTWVSCMRLYH